MFSVISSASFFSPPCALLELPLRLMIGTRRPQLQGQGILMSWQKPLAWPWRLPCSRINLRAPHKMDMFFSCFRWSSYGRMYLEICGTETNMNSYCNESEQLLKILLWRKTYYMYCGKNSSYSSSSSHHPHPHHHHHHHHHHYLQWTVRIFTSPIVLERGIQFSVLRTYQFTLQVFFHLANFIMVLVTILL